MGAIGFQLNQIKTMFLFVLAVVSSLGMIACGGGGGGGVADLAGGGISGTGASSGAITGFGSVLLNDSTFEVTSSTDISINDVSGKSQNDLKLGMVALVEFNGANATSIVADDELKGQVDFVDPLNNTLTVMGNVVFVDNNTIYDNIAGNSLVGINAGDFVEVHGFFDFLNSNIRASRLEKILQPGAGEFEVKGIVSNFDNPPGSFTIGTLTIDYLANNVTLPAGVGDGSFIEVKGDLIGNQLEAVLVEVEDELPGLDPEDEFEIEGIITFIDDPLNPTSIIINGVTVLVDNAIFENGDISDLFVGVKAEAEGSVNLSGELVATKISLRDSVRIEANVDAGTINAGSRTFMVLDTVTVRVMDFTELEDQLNNLPNFDFNDIQPNNYLEIRGFPDSSNSIVALRIRRDDDPGRTILQGTVQSVNNPDLQILEVVVTTNSSTEYEINDALSNEATFFGTVKAGDIVKVREDPTDQSDNLLTAKEVSLEGVNN